MLPTSFFIFREPYMCCSN